MVAINFPDGEGGQQDNRNTKYDQYLRITPAHLASFDDGIDQREQSGDRQDHAGAVNTRGTLVTGIKVTVALGLLVAAGGLYFSSQVYEVDADYLVIAVSLVIIAIGLGLVMAPATDSIMGSVPEHKAGIGSAMNDTTREIGGALGVAILGTVLNNVYINKIGVLKSQFPDLSAEVFEGVQDSIQGAHFVVTNPNFNLSPEISTTILDVANKAFVSGITDAMFIGALILIGAGSLVVAFLPAVVQPPEEEAEVKAADSKVSGQVTPASAGD